MLYVDKRFYSQDAEHGQGGPYEVRHAKSAKAFAELATVIDRSELRRVGEE